MKKLDSKKPIRTDNFRILGLKSIVTKKDSVISHFILVITLVGCVFHARLHF